MKALVTGGAGFIGSHLVRSLLSHGIDVRVFDLPKANRDNLHGLHIDYVGGDLTKPADVEAACDGMDLVFHLAAVVIDWGEWSAFERVNVGGTKNVLGAAKIAGVSRVVFMSSLAVHPYTGWRGADENTPRAHGGNPYSRSKILAEDACTEAARGGLGVTIVRPGVFPFGERDRTSFVPLADALLKGFYVHIDHGKSLITTSYAGNLTEGMVKAALSDRARGETYILGDTEPVSWRDLMERIAIRLGAKVPTMSIPGPVSGQAAKIFEWAWPKLGLKGAPLITTYRASVPRHDLYFSSRKAISHFGYRLELGLNEALDRTVGWWRTI